MMVRGGGGGGSGHVDARRLTMTPDANQNTKVTAAAAAGEEEEIISFMPQTTTTTILMACLSAYLNICLFVSMFILSSRCDCGRGVADPLLHPSLH